MNAKTVRYKESGLDTVWLADVPVWRCSAGHEEFEIPAVDQLHDLLAGAVLLKPVPLSGAEVRFLRQRAGFTGQQFAERIGITAVHLSRLERGHRSLPRPMDLLIRLFCVHVLAQRPGWERPPDLVSLLDRSTSGGPSPDGYLFRHRRVNTGRTDTCSWVAVGPPATLKQIPHTRPAPDSMGASMPA